MSRVVVTGIGEADPLWHLLDDPALVLAADACPVHLHRARFELAALRCLSRQDFLRIDRPGRRERLYGRVRWLLPADTAAWWDVRLSAPEPAGFHAPVDAADFDVLKVRADRLLILDRPLAALLAGLPDGFASRVILAPGCEEADLSVEAARVLRAPEEVFSSRSGSLQPRSAD
jgi:hypothetical protein